MAQQTSFRLFGFKISRGDEDQSLPESPVVANLEDGAINIQTGAHYGVYVDLDGTYRTEVDLITKYRTMSMQPEMESAIEDIVNEAIVHDEHGKIVKIELEDLKQPDNVKKMIRDEFEECLKLLDFNNFGTEIFRRWYVDGRCYYNVVIDKDDPRAGIKTLIYIDPRRIRKIRNITKKKNEQGVEIIDRIDTFYLYNEKVVNSSIQSPQIVGSFAGGVKLSEDSVIHLTSGLFDPAKSTVLSYLHKAIRPMNQLRFVEDATVIYRVSRAPERRVFYVDVGGLPKAKAEQYLKDIMNKFRNKLVYDAGTGEIKDQTRHMCLAMDTKVPLLDGRILTIAEMQKEHEEGKQNWVYSCDPVTGKFVPGVVNWAGVARKDAQVMKITLDNGETIVCTPDHRFPVWNKGMIAAENIISGESMIPFYKKKELIDSSLKSENKDYEMIWLNDKKSWNYTHREVSKWKDQEKQANQFTFSKENWTPENKVAASQRAIKNNLSKKGNDARWAKHRAEKEAISLRNHKVVKIEYLEELMDMGCLTIGNDYHTFALDAGIYTENSMLEDFWMPRRGEGKSTEITTLPAGQNLGQMEDVLYFEKKLYKALGVPPSRLESNQGFSLGRASEITRDEIKFDKFVDKLRSRFSILFDELLARQLSLKGVCTLDEWNSFKMDIHYKFIKDNNFTELKEAELLTNRVNLLMIVDPFIGRFYSKRWVQENVLMFDEEEIEEMEEQMDKENEEMAKEAEANAAADPNAGQSPQDDPMASKPGAPAAPGGAAPAPASTPEELNDRVKKKLGA